jgi:hypothetical protein
MCRDRKMAKKETTTGKPAAETSGNIKRVSGSALTQGSDRKKGERWVVSSGGEKRTYTTSDTSKRVIEGAAKKYSKALKRLADR